MIPVNDSCKNGSPSDGIRSFLSILFVLIVFILQQGCQTAACQDSQPPGRAGESRVEAVARQQGIRIVVCVCIGQDHAVKLKPLCVGQSDEKYTILRKTAARTDDRDRAAAQKIHCLWNCLWNCLRNCLPQGERCLLPYTR